MENASRKSYTIIPPGELGCVWMSAGLVAYQLCDRAYECDRCPFDAAMHRQNVQPERSIELPVRMEKPEDLRDGGMRYSADHCWLRPVNDRTLRVGIEPGLASALLVPKAVVLPAVGQQLTANQPCVWIILENGTFPILASTDGEVTARNTQAMADPQEVFLHPFDQGWLYEITPDREQAGMMDRETARRVYADDSLRFTQLLDDALRQMSVAVGATLADGGKPLQNISSMLGSKRYYSIVREAFGQRSRRR